MNGSQMQAAAVTERRRRGHILFGCFIVDAALQYPTLTMMNNLEAASSAVTD